MARADADAPPYIGSAATTLADPTAGEGGKTMTSQNSGDDFILKGSKGVQYTAEEERRVVRRIDVTLLPGLTALYLLSFLDRSNIGNAKLLGMFTTGHITNPSAYNTSLALYFLGYVLFEVPANMVLKKLNPKIWLPILTIAWGITGTLQGLIRSQNGLYVARFFMGVSEAGLFPGCIFVFSMYYKRNERHWRVAVFFGGAALAGAFGGILAWAIGHMVGVGNQPAWAWIFYLEGMLTVVIGLSAFLWIPGYPRDSKFLTPRDKEILLARLAEDGDSADSEPFSWSGVLSAFKEPLVLLYCALFHGFAFPLYSLSLFLPTIIAQLGYASWQAQLLTVPVYAVAFFSIVVTAWASHAANTRGLLIIGAGFVAIVGYIVLLTTLTAGARYAGAFIAVVGIYSGNALVLSWPSENVSPQTKRATATALQIFLGDIGAISGVLVYRPSLNGHFYRKPHIIAIGYTIFAILVSSTLYLWMRKGNRRRASLATGSEKGFIEKESIQEGETRLGDKHDSFVYQL